MFRFVVPLLAAGLFDCAGNGIDWVRFNDADDGIQFEVTTALDRGDPITSELHSTTGAVVVGTVTISPGSGPVGTLHTVIVEIADDYEEIVGRVTIAVDAGNRGLDDFEMLRDSADHGFWELELESSGVLGESRTDAFEVRLFEEDDGTSGADTGS